MYGEIELEIICEVCSGDLEVVQLPNRDFSVTPCPECLRDAKKEGYEEGYLDGESEVDN